MAVKTAVKKRKSRRCTVTDRSLATFGISISADLHFVHRQAPRVVLKWGNARTKRCRRCIQLEFVHPCVRDVCVWPIMFPISYSSPSNICFTFQSCTWVSKTQCVCVRARSCVHRSAAALTWSLSHHVSLMMSLLSGTSLYWITSSSSDSIWHDTMALDANAHIDTQHIQYANYHCYSCKKKWGGKKMTWRQMVWKPILCRSTGSLKPRNGWKYWGKFVGSFPLRGICWLVCTQCLLMSITMGARSSLGSWERPLFACT